MEPEKEPAPVEGAGTEQGESVDAARVMLPDEQAAYTHTVAQSHGFLARIKKQPLEKKLVVVGVLLAIVVFGLLVMSRMLSDGNVARLTPDSKNGIAFERPSNWRQSKEENGLVYFTESGSDTSDMNRGLIVGVQRIGLRYSVLAEEDRTNIRRSFESEFSSSEAISGDQCDQITNVQTNELVREGYDLAFEVDAECPQLKDGKTGGKIKMFVGWADVDLHVVGIVADTQTWNSEGAELDAIVNSIKPE